MNNDTKLLKNCIGTSPIRNSLNPHRIVIPSDNNISDENVDLIQRYGINAFEYIRIKELNNNSLIIFPLSNEFKTELYDKVITLLGKEAIGELDFE